MIFRFVRDEQEKEKIDPSNISEKDYGNILAKKYYDKLYKEFAIVDLSRY
jgi:protein FRA10AC1